MNFKPEKFRPTSARRRLLIVGLTLATVVFVVWAMTRKSGLVRNAAQHPADVAACAPGQTTGCVGSTTQVIALPASAPAAPAAASR